MATTTGVISQVSTGPTSNSLSVTAATGGTAPYTYQWYRSTTSGFTPGGGNIVTGATARTLNDSGLIPNTQYYYKVISTDAGAVAATSAQLPTSTTAPVQQLSQMSQGVTVGMLDLRFNTNTVSVQIDSTQATALYAGAAVKIVDSAGGIPKVIGCAANADEVFGFINYDGKSQTFEANSLAEISQGDNVMYLYATGAIARGVQVQLDLSTNGGVAAVTGSSGADLVGYAYDKASAAGTLIRVRLKVPSFAKA